MGVQHVSRGVLVRDEQSVGGGKDLGVNDGRCAGTSMRTGGGGGGGHAVVSLSLERYREYEYRLL